MMCFGTVPEDNGVIFVTESRGNSMSFYMNMKKSDFTEMRADSKYVILMKIIQA